jgi:hypothetical protein
MSGMSDSFGGFDLNFEGSSAAAAAAAAGSTEHVHDPETPPAANTPAAKR